MLELSPISVIILNKSKATNLNLIIIEHKYFSYDSIKDRESIQKTIEEELLNSSLQGQILTPELLHEIHEPGVPLHELHLTASAICVIMRNLSLEDGLVKNARVVIKKVFKNVIEVELVGVEILVMSKRKIYNL
ncbi:hypothetical protein L873DRAFT_245429 [Choiromyces venosus 120613-1]|uniref:DNA helicase n=1 Tax=Choiromyces venosus 120613-1 TaxID=1336337 RepID=A0A3N4JE07_9PEZI|nr:hypothetical protein L873DRAFT_245429 [Choiromyces venosus 120613-1]